MKSQARGPCAPVPGAAEFVIIVIYSEFGLNIYTLHNCVFIFVIFIIKSGHTITALHMPYTELSCFCCSSYVSRVYNSLVFGLIESVTKVQEPNQNQALVSLCDFRQSNFQL